MTQNTDHPQSIAYKHALKRFPSLNMQPKTAHIILIRECVEDLGIPIHHAVRGTGIVFGTDMFEEEALIKRAEQKYGVL